MVITIMLALVNLVQPSSPDACNVLQEIVALFVPLDSPAPLARLAQLDTMITLEFAHLVPLRSTLNVSLALPRQLVQFA